jgi:hypothetical protein
MVIRRIQELVSQAKLPELVGTHGVNASIHSQHDHMVASQSHLNNFLLGFYNLRNSVDASIPIALFAFNHLSEVPAHDKQGAVAALVSCKPSVGLDLDDLGIEHAHNNGGVFHDALPLVLALVQLLNADEVKVDAPVGVELLLPLL